MNLTIIGTGFVGVVSAAVFAKLGNQVIGLDIDQNKVNSLKMGQVPFYEPQLEELLLAQQKKGTLTFTTNYQTAISSADLVIIAVGTPSAADEQADLRYIWAAARSLAPHLKENAIVAIKSTVPPGTLDQVKIEVDQTRAEESLPKIKYYLASLPEFLKEGSAVADTLHPDRIVIGATDGLVFETLEKLHQPLKAPVVKMTPASAQMCKYTANSYLATRITFINQIADLCEQNQADINEVITGIGYDERIGHHYWYPGLGYGGSCFPKDVKELAAYSRSVGEHDNLLNKINSLNKNRIPKIINRLNREIDGFKDKTVAILGLSFKPNTDDTREAPASKIVPLLLEKEATINSYDPMATWEPQTKNGHYTQVQSIKKACQQAQVIMALVEWPQITEYDFSQVKQVRDQFFFDARNQFNPQKMTQSGYHYIGIGRSSQDS